MKTDSFAFCIAVCYVVLHFLYVEVCDSLVCVEYCGGSEPLLFYCSVAVLDCLGERKVGIVDCPALCEFDYSDFSELETDCGSALLENFVHEEEHIVLHCVGLA